MQLVQGAPCRSLSLYNPQAYYETSCSDSNLLGKTHCFDHLVHSFCPWSDVPIPNLGFLFADRSKTRILRRIARCGSTARRVSTLRAFRLWIVRLSPSPACLFHPCSSRGTIQPRSQPPVLPRLPSTPHVSETSARDAGRFVRSMLECANLNVDWCVGTHHRSSCSVVHLTWTSMQGTALLHRSQGVTTTCHMQVKPMIGWPIVLQHNTVCS